MRSGDLEKFMFAKKDGGYEDGLPLSAQTDPVDVVGLMV